MCVCVGWSGWRSALASFVGNSEKKAIGKSGQRREQPPNALRSPEERYHVIVRLSRPWKHRGLHCGRPILLPSPPFTDLFSRSIPGLPSTVTDARCRSTRRFEGQGPAPSRMYTQTRRFDGSREQSEFPFAWNEPDKQLPQDVCAHHLSATPKARSCCPALICCLVAGSLQIASQGFFLPLIPLQTLGQGGLDGKRVVVSRVKVQDGSGKLPKSFLYRSRIFKKKLRTIRMVQRQLRAGRQRTCFSIAPSARNG